MIEIWLRRMGRAPLLASLAALLTVSLAACSPQQRTVSSSGETPSTSAPAETVAEKPVLPDDADPALWILRDEDTVVYLFGTVHILKPGLTWFDDAVKDAFDRSDELVIEMIAPDTAALGAIVSEMAIDKTGISLRDKLAPEDRVKYEAALERLNVPARAFDPLEPWFASISVAIIPLTKKGYIVESGVENDLTALAQERGMDIIGLETLKQQFGFFDNLPQETQIGYLNTTIATLDEMTSGMDDMVAHWANANIGSLAEMMNAGLEDALIHKTILTDRNAAWAQWVKSRMDKPGTVFLAVGAGHLAGEGSLQDKLQDNGLIVERIEY